MKLTPLIAAAMCVAATVLAAPQTSPQPSSKVALTFDDLPDHGPLPPGMTRVDLAKSILGTLKAHHAPPVYGFINAKQLETRPADVEVLRLWRQAGFPLGNHTYSHMSLDANTVDSFEADVVANEATLQTQMGDGDWHWFRYPFLQEGNTAEKYHGVRDMLARHKYRIAEVTLSFDDYAYNDPYARCMARNDRDAVKWLEQSYQDRAAASLTRGRDQAHQLVGHDIGHVMLLHIGAFETVMLPRLLDLLDQQGFVLTTLEDAQKDAAYATLPDTGGNWSGTMFDQMAAARHLPAPPATDVFQRLGALCK
jgi:peptidoglycan/xylan/chitin deacetylase (PgdA/CDA1 family)